jgi:hypothetical protein
VLILNPAEKTVPLPLTMNEVGELVHPVAVAIVTADPILTGPPVYAGKEHDTTCAYVLMIKVKAVPMPAILLGVIVTVLTVFVIPVGVPDTAPVEEETVNPEGREPVITNEVGELAHPVTALLYAEFVRAVSGVVVNAQPDGVVKLKETVNAVPAPALLLGVTVYVDVPAPPIGVPVIAPVAVANIRPLKAPLNELDKEKDEGEF